MEIAYKMSLVSTSCVGKRSFVNYCRALSLWVVVEIVGIVIYGLVSGEI